MVVGVLMAACAGDDPASDSSNASTRSEPTIGSTTDTGATESTIRKPEQTAPVAATAIPVSTPAAVASTTTIRADVSSTAPEPTTTPTVDEWDQYYPIEYAPGFRLRITEPAPCGVTLRPAIVTANGYISPQLVDRGFVVVDVRADGPDSRTFDAQFLQSIADVSARVGIAVQWLRAHADSYCVAPDAIAVTGYSYGGIAVLALAYTDGEADAGQLVVVDLMGPPVVSETRRIQAPAELAAFSNDPDAVVAHAGFALVDTIDAGEPPALLFHGRNDPLTPFALAEQTCAAAHAVGIVCEIVAHDEGHAFAEDNLEAVDIVTAFLEREMAVPAGLSLE